MANGYLEKVYERWEKAGFSMSWLRGFNEKTSPNAFEEKGIELYDQYQLKVEAERITNVDRLTEIQELLAKSEDSPLKNEAIAAIEKKLEVNNEGTRIKNELATTEDYDALRKLRNDADRISDPALVNQVEKKMDKINKELERLSNERAQERIKQEQTEKIRAKEEERLKSPDRRKAANAKRNLDRMRERGEIE